MSLPDWQHIEDAFKAPAEVIGKLPETTESKRATDHLKLAERYTYEARERARADRTEDAAAPGTSVALGSVLRSLTKLGLAVDGA